MSEAEAFMKVLSKVSAEAKEEILSGLAESLRQAEAIIAKSENESKQEVEKILMSAHRQSDTLKRRIIGSAETAARNQLLQLVEQNVNYIFDKALEKLKHNASAHDAPVLEMLLREALGFVGSNSVVVSANEGDRKPLAEIAKKLGHELGVPIRVEGEPISRVGGLRVTTEDGSVAYDNTFEARLERAKPFLRRRLTDLLTRGV